MQHRGRICIGVLALRRYDGQLPGSWHAAFVEISKLGAHTTKLSTGQCVQVTTMDIRHALRRTWGHGWHHDQVNNRPPFEGQPHTTNAPRHVWADAASYRRGIFRKPSSHTQVSVGTGLQTVHGLCLPHKLWPVKQLATTPLPSQAQARAQAPTTKAHAP